MRLLNYLVGTFLYTVFMPYWYVYAGCMSRLLPNILCRYEFTYSLVVESEGRWCFPKAIFILC